MQIQTRSMAFVIIDYKRQQIESYIQEAIKTKELAVELAKEMLEARQFYSTNAIFPDEISTKSPKMSPLPSFKCLSSAELSEYARSPDGVREWNPVRVTVNTDVYYSAGKKKKKLARRHPCFLARYDKETNEAIMFLGSSQKPDPKVKHRYATVITLNDSNDRVIVDESSLITIPPNAFKKTTYFNLSHPIRVQLWFIAWEIREDTSGKKPKDTSGKKPKDTSREKRIDTSFDSAFKNVQKHGPEPTKPAAVGITFFFMGEKEKKEKRYDSVYFNGKSEAKFRELHMTYHRERPRDISTQSDGNEGGGDGPGSGGSRRSGGDGGSGGGEGGGGGGGGEGGGGGGGGEGGGGDGGGGSGGSGGSGGGEGGGGGGGGEGGGGDGGGGSGGSSGGGRVGGPGGNRSWDEGNGVGDGDRRGNLRPRNGEANESVSNVAFRSRGVLVLYHEHETDAPWGKIGDDRIGIDVPLVEDDCNFNDPEQEQSSSEDSDEEDSSEDDSQGDTSDEESSIPEDAPDQEDCDIDKETDVSQQPSTSQAQVHHPVGESEEVECTGLGPNEMYKFALNLVGFPTRICGELKYENMVWSWKRMCNKRFTSHAFLSKEGMYFERCDGVQKVSKFFADELGEPHVLPPSDLDNKHDIIRFMVVDTSDFSFKVITGGYALDTMIYDSRSRTQTKTKLLSKYPRTDIQEWMTRGGSVVYDSNVVFILYHWRADIVVYFMELDKWGFITPPCENIDFLLCGIGCWKGHIYCSTTHEEGGQGALHTWRLNDWEKDPEKDWEWIEFSSMPTSDYHWLVHNSNHIQVRIFTSFHDQQALFYSYTSSSSRRLVLFDMAEKTWRRISLDFKLEDSQVVNIKSPGVEVGSRQSGTHRRDGGISEPDERGKDIALRQEEPSREIEESLKEHLTIGDDDASRGQVSSKPEEAEMSRREPEAGGLSPDLNRGDATYFAIDALYWGMGPICGLLEYDHSSNTGKWKWLPAGAIGSADCAFLTAEGLYYERRGPAHKVVDTMSNEIRVLPELAVHWLNTTCMAVDTSVRPYTFKVIVADYISAYTHIYDSTTPDQLWGNPHPIDSLNITRGSGQVVSMAYFQEKVFITERFHLLLTLRVFNSYVYDTKENKWGEFYGPTINREEIQVCGIGICDNQLYCSTLSFNGGIKVWKRENSDWFEIDTMPLEMKNLVLRDLSCVSFSGEKVIFVGHDFKCVMYNLHEKGSWKKFDLPDPVVVGKEISPSEERSKFSSSILDKSDEGGPSEKKTPPM